MLRQTQNELLPWFGLGVVIIGALAFFLVTPLIAQLTGGILALIVALLPIAAGCALGWRSLSRGIPSGWWLSVTAAITAAYLPLLLLAESCIIGLPAGLLQLVFSEVDAFLIAGILLLLLDVWIIAIAVRARLRR